MVEIEAGAGPRVGTVSSDVCNIFALSVSLICALKMNDFLISYEE